MIPSGYNQPEKRAVEIEITQCYKSGHNTPCTAANMNPHGYWGPEYKDDKSRKPPIFSLFNEYLKQQWCKCNGRKYGNSKCKPIKITHK